MTKELAFKSVIEMLESGKVKEQDEAFELAYDFGIVITEI